MKTPWEAEVELLPVCDDYVIVDSVCAELSQLFSNEGRQTFFQEMQSLFKLIDHHFDAMFRTAVKARIQNKDGAHLRSVDSTFAMCLKLFSWLPAVKTSYSIGEPPTSREVARTMTSESIYIPSAAVEQLLANHVWYLACPIKSQSFAEFLSLRKDVSVEAVKSMLLQIGRGGSKDDSTSGDDTPEVVVSRAHIKNVYRYLSHTLPPVEFQNLFDSNPVIFHPRTTGPDTRFHDICVGVFLRRDQCWWRDPSQLFNKYHNKLVLGLDARDLFKSELWSEYREHDFHEMFVRVARVQSGPDVECFTKLLLHVTRAASLSTSTLEDIIKVPYQS